MTIRIGILLTGRVPDALRQEHGDYDDMFVRLFSDHDLTFDTYPVRDSVLPANVRDADGWLITGSKFGVYETHPWIAPLEAFLCNAYAAAIPVVGVCFGHQILAQALGGKVEKFAGGWSIGPAEYQINGNTERIFSWHQDQIVQLPTDAAVIGSSHFCKYAMIGYGNHALSIQPHPEFTTAFMRDLLKIRQDSLPPEIAKKARKSLDRPGELTSTRIADRIAGFFVSHSADRIRSSNRPAFAP